MKETIIAQNRLSEDHIEDIRRLYVICNSHDDTKYTFDQDDDFANEGDINTFLLYRQGELICSINIFAPTRKEAEIIALTHPRERGRGCFALLLAEAVKEIARRGIESILFVCDARSAPGNRVVCTMGANYEYSEYLLNFDKEGRLTGKTNDAVQINRVKREDKDELVRIIARAFGTKEEDESDRMADLLEGSKRRIFSIRYESRLVGMIGVYDEEDRIYIFGFCIDPDYQKKGIGSQVLSETVKTCLPDGRDIVLEVEAENAGALKVYRNIGFVVEAEFKYYRFLYS